MKRLVVTQISLKNHQVKITGVKKPQSENENKSW